jgi:natural product precursor
MFEKFKKNVISNEQMSNVKGGMPVYVPCGSNTCVYDCHMAHGDTTQTHCIYIAEIPGQMA